MSGEYFVLMTLIIILLIVCVVLGVKLRVRMRGNGAHFIEVSSAEPRAIDDPDISGMEAALLRCIASMTITPFVLERLYGFKQSVPLDTISEQVRVVAQPDQVPLDAIRRTLRILSKGPFVSMDGRAKDEQYEITSLGRELYGKIIKYGLKPE
jgi:hypothetical protein